jgi:hypothetical protein
VEGESKVKRSKRTSELRFTDNSMLEKMLVVGKRLSWQMKIVQERGLMERIHNDRLEQVRKRGLPPLFEFL